MWPLGPARNSTTFRVMADGTITANGVHLTDAAGWMLVRLPEPVTAAGGPPALSIRLRVSQDAEGTVHLYAADVRAGGQVFPSVAALAAAGALWVRHLAEAVHAEVDRCVTTPDRPTRSLRAIRSEDIEAARRERAGRGDR